MKIAQTYYTDDEVVSDTANTNYETRRSYSDIAASIDIAISNLTLSTAVQFDPEINEIAASAIRKDKKWEAANGFIRGWSAHVYHMRTAAEPFKKIGQQRLNLSQNRSVPTNFPINIEVPSGAITEEGTRRNIRTVIEYCEGWLSGRGAKGINSMEGKPGKNPA